jgi:hypothetical protein
MAWGEVEVHPDVREWLLSLGEVAFAQAERSIDRLAENGPLLGEPYTRQLRGKLRELRFHLDRQQVRVTYFIASGRTIVLLTVFRKTKGQERAEIDRAEREMERCITEGHTLEGS